MKQVVNGLIALVALVLVAGIIVLCFLFMWGTLIGIAIGIAALMVLIWPIMGVVWVFDWVEQARLRRTMADLAKLSQSKQKGKADE